MSTSTTVYFTHVKMGYRSTCYLKSTTKIVVFVCKCSTLISFYWVYNNRFVHCSHIKTWIKNNNHFRVGSYMYRERSHTGDRTRTDINSFHSVNRVFVGTVTCVLFFENVLLHLMLQFFVQRVFSNGGLKE